MLPLLKLILLFEVFAVVFYLTVSTYDFVYNYQWRKRLKKPLYNWESFYISIWDLVVTFILLPLALGLFVFLGSHAAIAIYHWITNT